MIEEQRRNWKIQLKANQIERDLLSKKLDHVKMQLTALENHHVTILSYKTF